MTEKTIHDLMGENQDNPYVMGQLSVMHQRGVEVPCEKCSGIGVRAYPNTATWAGGIGGSMVTPDVCDVCWGTGDKHRKGVNLRTLRQRTK